MHGSCRDIAFVADLCAREPRLRAGRGRLAVSRPTASAISISPRASRSTALGHAHPHLVAALTRAGAQALARLQPLSHPGSRAAGRAAVRSDLRRPRVLRQFRRRGDGMRDQDGAQIPLRQRQSRSATASSPSRAPSTAARWRRIAADRQQEISRRLRPAGRGLRPGAVRRSRRGRRRRSAARPRRS